MKKLFVCICSLILVFLFVSCQTSPEATPEASELGKPLAPGSFNLNGKWKWTSDWKTEYSSGTEHGQYEILQKGMEINLISIPSGPKFMGTLKGSIIHMEPAVFYDPKGSRVSLPAREHKISQDGNTLTGEFDYTWSPEGAGRERLNLGSISWTAIRE